MHKNARANEDWHTYGILTFLWDWSEDGNSERQIMEVLLYHHAMKFDI